MNETTIEIPIIRKLYELYKLFYGYLELFPKKDKHALGAKCEGYIIDTLELLLAAGSVAKQDKKQYILKANVKFDALKVFLRIAKELRLLDGKKYIELQKHIQEIGRMLGGWQRSLE
jgi:23S rRNA-intervening sequence protein